MNLPKISVMIPIYNTEPFLRRCLDSIINQTYKNIEMVIVNDASKDNSESIINEYINNGFNIKYIKHEQNRGLLAARITGIENASGDYYAFLDSDDYVSRDFYRKLLVTIQRKNADICFADYVLEFEDGRKTYANLDPIRNSDLALHGEEILDTFMSYEGTCYSWWVVWNKLYKKEVVLKSLSAIKDFSEQAGRIVFEDLLLSTSYFMHANKVVNCHNVWAYYYRHEDAITQNKNNKIDLFIDKLHTWKQVFAYLHSLFLTHGLLDKYAKNLHNYKLVIGRTYYSVAQQLKSKKVSQLMKEVFPDVDSAPLPEDYYFYHSYPFIEYAKYEHIIEMIQDEQIRVVSFDVFDTLLLRKTLFPTDVFHALNEKYERLTGCHNYTPFKFMRIEAEKQARLLTKNEDITIEDIYIYI